MTALQGARVGIVARAWSGGVFWFLTLDPSVLLSYPLYEIDQTLSRHIKNFPCKKFQNSLFLGENGSTSYLCLAPRGESEKHVLEDEESSSGAQKGNAMSMEASKYAVDEANAKQLTFWLTAGKWSLEQATLLFQEIDPDRQFGECFSTFSGHGEVQYEYFDDERKTSVPCGVDEEGEPTYLTAEQDDLLHKTKQLCRQIGMKLNLYDSAEPHEWIELACKKGVAIPWLNWAIEMGLYVEKIEAGVFFHVPVVREPVLQWDLLATPTQLISVFGTLTGMSKMWFNNAKDTPKLKAALHTPGKSGRNGREPLYHVFLIMQWLINPKRRKGKSMEVATGWRMLKNQFPAVYRKYQDQDPDAD